ncbi:hypothetical protein ACFV98_02525 [Streptomyces violascens]|uniref:hypothetical protein n=1 Tax=Streptomyces violascens TaxID=67381 RepID=UPI003664C97C
MTSATALAHRTVLTVPNANTFLNTVRQMCGAWLKEKYCTEVPLTTGQHHLDDTSLLTLKAAHDANGSEYAVRLLLRQDLIEATWRTTVTAVRTGEREGGLACVDLECFPNAGHTVHPGKPRLVRDLVRELEPYDGLSRLSGNALRVTRDQVARLVDVLCDPARQLPAVVAARPLRPDPLWSERAAQTMQHIAGDASSYLLWDVPAVEAFRAAVGESHRVAPGAVRTFLPEVDPAWAPDTARHRYLANGRWADPADPAWRGVARRVHALCLERQLPEAMTQVSFPDRTAEQYRQERRESMDKAKMLATVPAPRTGEAEPELRAEVTLLNGLLEQADKELTEAERTAELAERTNTSLRGQVQGLLAERDSEIEDHLISLDRLQKAQVEADRLRLLLLRQGRAQEVADATAALPGIPASFEELWERLAELEHLTVTADRRVALDLDEYPMARTWAAKAWTALGSLDSYAWAAKGGFNGGFYQFCLQPPAGAKPYPIKQVAMTESAPTMEQYGHERLFPGPVGLVEMQAHLKLGARGRIAPRIYFLDGAKATTGETAGRLVVGYVGPHLTNMQT